MRVGLVGTAGRVLAVSLGLAFLNAVVVLPLFAGEYSQYMGSIEASRLGEARFIDENWPYAGWNPLSYLGFPFHLFYTPLLPYLVAAIHRLPLVLSTAAAYRLITAFAYVLGPVTLYLFVRYLTKRDLTAVLAALAYSLMPSFVYLIGGVRSDTPAGLFGHAPWRLIVMTWYGEGPHIAALTLTPLAVLFFLRALKKPTFAGYVIAALALAAIALTNWIALFAVVLILAVVLFSEMLLGEPGRKLISAFAVAAIAYGLSAFWLNLSFVKASLAFGNPSGTALDYNPVLLLSVSAPLAGICYLMFSGKPQRQKLFIPAAWFAIFAVIVFGWYQFDLNLVPQPNRYAPELNMAAVILGAMLVTVVYDRFRSNAADLGKAAAPALVAVAVAAIVIISLPFLRAAWDATRASADISRTTEYQVARWLEDNTAGARVYATGTHAFWLNAFASVPQVRGGHDGGAVNPWWDHVVYQINHGADGELAVMWAKALNVRYIVVNFPDSEVVYQDFAHPHKFDGLLPERFSYGGDTVYEVPTASPEPVQVVNLSRFQALPPIEDVLDRDGLEAYVQAVEASEGVDPADVKADGPGRMTITADLAPGQGLLVRTTYHRGWTARAEGTKVARPPKPRPLPKVAAARVVRASEVGK
ncbi:hypothetical protein LCGC14_1394420 [marine sediment metagenome]|uniref:Uncharacterized protein n=1 Tax=marine sediment metagenome TaxID=412755 RepID=A0A0F9N0J9_9ZZZZ